LLFTLDQADGRDNMRAARGTIEDKGRKRSGPGFWKSEMVPRGKLLKNDSTIDETYLGHRTAVSNSDHLLFRA